MASAAPPGPDGSAGSDPGLAPSDTGASFLERLAHDLRGPLSPLQTAAYLLRREDLGAERQGELLDIIDRQTARLGGMVQEVSDWMRAQQSRLVGRREMLSVPMLVELGCAELAAVGATIDLPETLDEVSVLGDAQQLVQMLSTLVGYARSRADEGGVSVTATRVGDRIHIAIEQQGTPLPDAMLETLFTAPQPSPFDDGLGLRLLIAQAIAHEHGGHLSALSIGATKSELRVDLPIAN